MDRENLFFKLNYLQKNKEKALHWIKCTRTHAWEWIHHFFLCLDFQAVLGCSLSTSKLSVMVSLTTKWLDSFSSIVYVTKLTLQDYEVLISHLIVTKSCQYTFKLITYCCVTWFRYRKPILWKYSNFIPNLALAPAGYEDINPAPVRFWKLESSACLILHSSATNRSWNWPLTRRHMVALKRR